MREPIRDIDCLTAVRHLWDYLDQELDEPRMLEIEHHLEICQDCLRHAEFDRRFLDALYQGRSVATAWVTGARGTIRLPNDGEIGTRPSRNPSSFRPGTRAVGPHRAPTGGAASWTLSFARARAHIRVGWGPRRRRPTLGACRGHGSARGRP